MTGPAPTPGQTPGQPSQGWDPAVCQALREDVAVALLSNQPLPDQAHAHAQICPPCGDEFAELTTLPSLLSAVNDPTLPAPEQPSTLMLPRLLDQVSRRRRRVRWVTAAAAAAVVAFAIPIGFSLGRSGEPSASALPTPVPVATVTVSPSPDPDDEQVGSYSTGSGVDPQTGARVEVAVQNADWGSKVQVEIYDVPGGTQCRLVVVDHNNLRVESGSWTVPESGYTTGQKFPETVMTKPQDIRAIEIVDNRTNRVMVHIPVVRT